MCVVSKWGVSRVPPVTLAFLRVALGAVALFVLVRVSKPARAFSRRDWLDFLHLGVWVAVTLVTQFVGTALTNASQGSLLTVLTPVFTLALGVPFQGEALTLRKVGGMGLAAAGSVAVFFFAQPVVGAALRVTLLGESLGPWFVGSAAYLALTLPQFAMTRPVIAVTLVIVAALSVLGFGVLVPGEVRIYREMVSSDPDPAVISRIGMRNAKLSAVQGVLQLAVIAVMVYLRWGGF